MKTLNLVLKHRWFDLIKSGKKNAEYREFKPYWNKRFKTLCKGCKRRNCDINCWNYGFVCDSDFDKVKFKAGYAKDAETMTFEIDRIEKKYGKNDLGISPVWAIHLGERIE